MFKIILVSSCLLLGYHKINAQVEFTLPQFTENDLIFRFEESMVYASISLSDGIQSFQTGVPLDDKNLPVLLVAKIIKLIKLQGYQFVNSQSGSFENGNVSYVVSYYIFHRN